MDDAAGRARRIEERRARVAERMGIVKHKFVVLSGKGGVGKSTVAAYLASALAARGNRVGLLDADIHGPSIPKMLGVEGDRIAVAGDYIVPVAVGENLKVMSIAFLLRSKGDAVIWRGPLKITMIEEFLGNVEWGELDYLIIDSPPGTGDEPLSVCQFLPDLDGAIVVATPQEIALNDVEKSITFCRRVNIPVAGVIENMSGFVCPHCGKEVGIFKTGGAQRLALGMGVPFLGKLPLVPAVVDCCDRGHCSYADAERAGLKEALDEMHRARAAHSCAEHGASASHEAAVQRKAAGSDGAGAHHKATASHEAAAEHQAEGIRRRIALPLDGETVSSHFGHSPEFAVFDVVKGKIAGNTTMTPPPHSPGAIPAWLRENGVDVVISGGMGHRAVNMLESSGIEVVTGAPPGPPEGLVKAYLAGTLKTGENVCDH
jgi:ATP-binding protein involved in chromosome partitioning